MIDEIKLIKAIVKTLKREDVHRMTENSTLPDQSYMEKAGVTFIILSTPPELEKEMEEMALVISSAQGNMEITYLFQKTKQQKPLGCPERKLLQSCESWKRNVYTLDGTIKQARNNGKEV